MVKKGHRTTVGKLFPNKRRFKGGTYTRQTAGRIGHPGFSRWARTEAVRLRRKGYSTRTVSRTHKGGKWKAVYIRRRTRK